MHAQYSVVLAVALLGRGDAFSVVGNAGRATVPGSCNRHRWDNYRAVVTHAKTLRKVHKVRMNADTTDSGIFTTLTSAWNEEISPRDLSEFGPSISRVNTLPEANQALVFGAVFAGLGLGTYALLNSFPLLAAILPAGWSPTLRGPSLVPLGLIFVAAGLSHFTILEQFCDIYPGKGAWGLWYLPGSASFHVKWTGIAEIAGGLGLMAGGLGPSFSELQAASALGLFILTLAVTPANIFMFTHGAELPPGVQVPVIGHAIRGFMQCVLLSALWAVARA